MILLSAIWGSAFFAIKIGVENIHPFSVTSIRLLIGSIILIFIFNFKNLKIIKNYNILLKIFLIGLIGNFIPFTLINWSEIYIKSNTAGLLLSVGPILTLTFSHFFTSDDKFTKIKFISITVGFIGVLFIFGIDNNFVSASNFLPKISIIIAALGYVISSILAYNLKKINPITLTTFVTIFAAIMSLPFMIFIELQQPSNFETKSLFSVLYLGIFPTAIAFLIRFYIIANAGPIFLSYVAYLIPVFAIIWGYLFLGETVNLTTLIGVFLVLAGVFISQKNLIYK